jgi:hypothetical protein
MESKKAADTEHREKAEQHWGRGHAGDVKAQMDRSEQATEDVIEDQREQQESAPREKADAKDQIGDVQSVPTSA